MSSARRRPTFLSGKGTPTKDAPPNTPPYKEDGPSLHSPSVAESTLPEVIESLGTGYAQLRWGLLAGPVWFADGAELILISSVTTAVSQQWGFSACERGMVVTMVYLGVLFGNLASGPAGDAWGRRLPILISFFMIFFCSALSALAAGFWSLGISRFLVGMSIGLGQPAHMTLVSETTPAKWRPAFSSVGFHLFALGEVYTGFLLWADDPDMIDLHWRTLIVASAVPSFVFGILAVAFLQQSPLYLACGGRYEETQEVLESIRSDNGSTDVSIDFKPYRVICGGGGVQNHIIDMLRIIFGPEHIAVTSILTMCAFTLNLSYYGSLYAFPQVLSQGGVQIGSSPAAAVIIGGVVEFTAYPIAVVCTLCFPRLRVMKIYGVAMTSALVAFALGAPQQMASGLDQFLAMYGYYVSKFAVSIGFLVFYLYASEVYPTMARTTGTSVVFAGGRIAAMSGSLIYEGLLSHTGRFEDFFWLMGGLNLGNLLLVGLLTVETFGRVLNDFEGSQQGGHEGDETEGARERIEVRGRGLD